MSVLPDYILAFQKWCALDGKAASGSKYIGYLSCLNKEIGEPNHSTWNGLYRLLYDGKAADKEVVEVGSLEEFNRIYGGVRAIFTNKPCPPGVNRHFYGEAVKWAQQPEVRGPSCLNAALNAYCDFLRWLVEQEDIIAAFRAWMSGPGQNRGKGYKSKTVDRYVNAVVLIDNVLPAWGVDLGGRKLHQIRDCGEFLSVEQNIRSCPQFAGYNDNLDENGKAKNLNGTGNGDPSAALRLFGMFLSERSERESSAADPSLDVSVAVKLFALHRLDDEWVAVLRRHGYEGLHERYASMNPEMLRNMSANEVDAWVSDELWAARIASCREAFQELNAEGKTHFAAFVAATKKNVRLLSGYFGKDAQLPQGVGPTIFTELLMKFHPQDYMCYNALVQQGLKALGLSASDVMPSSPSVADYQCVMGQAGLLLGKLAAAKVPRRFDEDADVCPDYVTVNEFLCWVHEHKDLIKEKIMAKEFKKVERKPKVSGTKKLADVMKDELLKRLAAALRTKPFAILAGHSGTGKSQMVRRLAYMTCSDPDLMAEADRRNAPGNYCMIHVRPNWHDSTDLLGYYSEMGGKYRTTEFVEFVAKAYAYPDIPFFVCLDEMNLAPVEQYFAEYLSAIESADVKGGEFLTDALVPKKCAADEVMASDEVRFKESKAWFEAHGLTIPKNLFVVGTVNMDDTTCQFSRKVLDRAMTIMMDKVSFKDMQDAAKSAAPSKDDLLGEKDVEKFLQGKLRADPLGDDQVNMLESVDKVLGKTPFAVAYRFANEYALYEDSLIALEGNGATKDAAHAKAAMDHCVLMKVLPRVHGERKEMELLFRGNASGTEKGLEAVLDKDATLSGKKMEEILDRKSSYLSFWP